jgi:hypothetical protein
MAHFAIVVVLLHVAVRVVVDGLWKIRSLSGSFMGRGTANLQLCRKTFIPESFQETRFSDSRRPHSGAISQAVLIPVDHVVLNVWRKLRKVSAKATNAHNEITVFFGMNFCIP